MIRSLLMIALVLIGSASFAQSQADPLFDRQRSERVLGDPSSELSEEDFETVRRAPQLVEDTLASDPEIEAQAAAGRQLVEASIQEQIAGATSPMPERERDGNAKPNVLLFVSQSMGQGALREVFDNVRGRTDVVVFLRGGREGQNLGAVLTELRTLIGDVSTPDRAPRVAIDPTRFTAYRVTAVPTLVWIDGEDREVARAQGIANTDWFREQVADLGKRGDLGSFGSALEIIERDMAEVIRERLAAVDLTEEAEAGRKRYWQNLSYLALPTAVHPRLRLLDPTIEVTETIQTPDGEVIAHAGERINPLERVPFPDAIVIFNATDPAQVETARQLLHEHAARPVTLISTEFKRDGGWDWLAQTSNDLGRMVHLLQDDVRSRFQIERVPTVITAEGLNFRIEEIPATTAHGGAP